jgi:hypothetical protein
VGKAAYKYSGAQSVVSCVTNPTLSSCIQAAVAVAGAVLTVATGGAGAAVDVGLDAAADAATDVAVDAGEDAAESAAEDAGESTADDEAGSCVIGGQSFAADTKVLLASGAAVAISQLKPGEKVLATNTKTGKTQPETVTAVLLHYDTDLYNLTVRSNGRTEVIHTTSNHLFWDPSLNRWIAADRLKKSEHLKTPNGRSAMVVGGSVQAVHDGWMWDLTVPGNNDHDFYVVAGGASALVHNDSCSTNAQILDSNMQDAGITRPADTAAHHIVASTSSKAASARADLQSFGIDINDADNGVYLPRGSASSNPLGMAVHSQVHTNLYYDTVNEMMSWARNANEAQDVLGYIRTQLQSGPWPS